MKKEIILTQEGLEQKKEELIHLIKVVRPKVIEELVEARNQGDLSENADYDAARTRQSEIEARINEIESMINQAIILPTEDNNNSEIKISSRVTYSVLKTKEKIEVKIVGAVESDPEKGLISNESPLAKSILGKKSGDIIEIKNINKPYQIKIIDIK